MNILGLIGSILLTFCGLPELIRTIQDKRCHLGWGFVLMWFFGELFCFIYVLELKEIPLIMNYTFNLFISGTMLFFKIKNLLYAKS